MKWMALAAAALTALVVPVAAEEPEPQRGTSLLDACRSNDLHSEGFCLGFILGAVDGHVWGRAERESVYCVPPDVTAAQAREMVVKALRDHPEKLHVPAAILVIDAFERAFPCP